MKKELLKQVIKERRTIRSLSNHKLSISLIHELLETASFAPFHSRIEPWKVYTAETEQERSILVDAIMKSYDRLNVWAGDDLTSIHKRKKRTQEYFDSVPMSLVVTAPIGATEKVQLEATSAVSAFIQNFQLVAWQHDIGVTWRTIPVIFDTEFKKELGISKEEKIIGLLDLTAINSYTEIPIAKKRRPVEQWTSRLFDHEK